MLHVSLPWFVLIFPTLWHSNFIFVHLSGMGWQLCQSETVPYWSEGQNSHWPQQCNSRSKICKKPVSCVSSVNGNVPETWFWCCFLCSATTEIGYEFVAVLSIWNCGFLAPQIIPTEGPEPELGSSVACPSLLSAGQIIFVETSWSPTCADNFMVRGIKSDLFLRVPEFCFRKSDWSFPLGCGILSVHLFDRW